MDVDLGRGQPPGDLGISRVEAGAPKGIQPTRPPENLDQVWDIFEDRVIDAKPPHPDPSPPSFVGDSSPLPQIESVLAKRDDGAGLGEDALKEQGGPPIIQPHSPLPPPSPSLPSSSSVAGSGSIPGSPKPPDSASPRVVVDITQSVKETLTSLKDPNQVKAAISDLKSHKNTATMKQRMKEIKWGTVVLVASLILGALALSALTGGIGGIPVIALFAAAPLGAYLTVLGTGIAAFIAAWTLASPGPASDKEMKKSDAAFDAVGNQPTIKPAVEAELERIIGSYKITAATGVGAEKVKQFLNEVVLDPKIRELIERREKLLELNEKIEQQQLQNQPLANWPLPLKEELTRYIGGSIKKNDAEENLALLDALLHRGQEGEIDDLSHAKDPKGLQRTYAAWHFCLANLIRENHNEVDEAIEACRKTFVERGDTRGVLQKIPTVGKYLGKGTQEKYFEEEMFLPTPKEVSARAAEYTKYSLERTTDEIRREQADKEKTGKEAAKVFGPDAPGLPPGDLQGPAGLGEFEEKEKGENE